MNFLDLFTSSRTRAGGLPERLAIVLLAALVSIVMFPSPGNAAQPNARLGITPVNQDSNFFDVIMAPGEKRILGVELRNFGTDSMAVRTFPADAYTIVNGGFGARLRSEPKSGTTLWMNYKEEVLQLKPQQAVTRSFTVTVPQDAAPGDYITSLVIENENPIKGAGGAVAINQVQRQAIAVAISVPGLRSPALEFHGAAHSFVGERSVVAVALENSGNTRLKPAGRLKISDSRGKAVFDGPITMDSFYAKTTSSVEAPLKEPLRPGRYNARLDLEDPTTGLAERSRPLPFEVEGSPQAEGAGSGVRAREEDGPLPVWPIAIGTALVLLALIAGILLGRRQRAN